MSGCCYQDSDITQISYSTFPQLLGDFVHLVASYHQNRAMKNVQIEIEMISLGTNQKISTVPWANLSWVQRKVEVAGRGSKDAGTNDKGVEGVKHLTAAMGVFRWLSANRLALVLCFICTRRSCLVAQ